MTSRKAKLTIQPFRYVTLADVTPEQAQKSWEKLELALQRIFARDHHDLSFEELYRTAYNLVLHRYGELLYEGLERAFVEQALRLRGKVQSQAQDSESLLTSLQTQWLLYKTAVRTVRDVFMYADRSFIRSTGRKPVYDLGMSAFRERILQDQTFSEQIVDALLEIITHSRLGERPPLALVRDTLDMYIELDLYADAFERRFLQASREFYTMAADRVLLTCTGRSYLQHVREWFHFEEQMANECLEMRSTRAALHTLLGEILLAGHLSEILDTADSGFLSLLRLQRLEDLQMMYDLLVRIPEGIDAMRSRLAPYVRERVRADLAREQGTREQPFEWVARAIFLKDEFYSLLSALQMDPKFVRAVQEGFEEALNECPRAQEFLSLYIDRALEDSPSVSRESTRTALDHASALFRLLRSKDIFEQHYKIHLSRRLLRRFESDTPTLLPTNDDAEEQFIAKLREECGTVYTMKLESMIQDMRISDELDAEFRRQQELVHRHGSRSLPMLHVCVITSGTWPVPEPFAAEVPIACPELMRLAQAFQKFYHERHAKRRLLWLLHQGSAELRMQLRDHGPVYELKVTSLQMFILLLFNTTDILTVTQIIQALQAPSLTPEVTRALRMLSSNKHPLLCWRATGAEIEPHDEFRVNDAFENPNRRMNLTLFNDEETETASTEQTMRTADLVRDRRPEIMACIVRILKRHQTIEHNQLVAMVSEELRFRFIPTVAEVKREIEALLEREYIARDTNEQTWYRYVA
jgi:cullin 3